MRRLRAIVAVVALVIMACGGGDGDADASPDSAADETAAPTEAATTQPPSDDEGGTETTAPAPAESGGDEGAGPSTATVTLGEDTYTFSSDGALVAQCLTDFFGIFSVQLAMADGGDGSVQIVGLYPDTDPEVVGEVNAVEVSVGDEDWVADESSDLFDQFDALEPGMGQVDSLEIDGRTVRGTATFFRQNSVFTDDVETLSGSFEATCGEERTS